MSGRRSCWGMAFVDVVESALSRIWGFDTFFLYHLSGLSLCITASTHSQCVSRCCCFLLQTERNVSQMKPSGTILNRHSVKHRQSVPDMCFISLDVEHYLDIFQKHDHSWQYFSLEMSLFVTLSKERGQIEMENEDILGCCGNTFFFFW